MFPYYRYIKILYKATFWKQLKKK